MNVNANDDGAAATVRITAVDLIRLIFSDGCESRESRSTRGPAIERSQSA